MRRSNRFDGAVDAASAGTGGGLASGGDAAAASALAAIGSVGTASAEVVAGVVVGGSSDIDPPEGPSRSRTTPGMHDRVGPYPVVELRTRPVSPPNRRQPRPQVRNGADGDPPWAEGVSGRDGWWAGARRASPGHG